MVFVDGEMLDNPVTAIDDSVSIGEDDSNTEFGSVLSNDQFNDGVATVALLTGPEAGLLSFNEDGVDAPLGSFSFDPNGAFEDLRAGESRNVSFSYVVTDTDGDTDQAVVTVLVQGANDAPVAINKFPPNRILA